LAGQLSYCRSLRPVRQTRDDRLRRRIGTEPTTFPATPGRAPSCVTGTQPSVLRREGKSTWAEFNRCLPVRMLIH